MRNDSYGKDEIMSSEKVVVEMRLNAPKKHSVRYDGEGQEPGITSLYVMNRAINKLGKIGEPVPAKRIRVTIERIE